MEEFKDLITNAFESMDIWKYRERVTRETLEIYAKMCNVGVSDKDAHAMALEVIREMERSGYKTIEKESAELCNLSLDCDLRLCEFFEFYQKMYADFPDLVEEEMDNLKKFQQELMTARKNPFKITIGRHYKIFEDYKHLECFDAFSNETISLIVELLEGNEQEQFLPKEEFASLLYQNKSDFESYLESDFESYLESDFEFH